MLHPLSRQNLNFRLRLAYGAFTRCVQRLNRKLNFSDSERIIDRQANTEMNTTYSGLRLPIALMLLTLIGLLAIPSARAAEIIVDDDCTLADAIESANTDSVVGGCPAGDGADTIGLSADIKLREATPLISTEIAIAGNGYTIDGSGEFEILNVGEEGKLQVSHLTFTRGFGSNGGAISVSYGDVVISDCVFHKNQANSSGGALDVIYGSATIIRSTFSDNVAQGGGGALVFGSATVTISESVFSGNSANLAGAIGSQASELTISDSVFSENNTNYDGGAIGGEDAPLTISGSTFSNNTAAGHGGAIYYEATEVTVTDSAFDGNFAQETGGALYIKDAMLNISASNFDDNNAVKAGGAIDLNAVTATISDSGMSGNKAEAAGAFVIEGGDVTVERSKITRNSAEFGGAAWAFGGKLAITDSVLRENKAAIFAGAIMGMNDAELEISQSWFDANEARDFGGALAVGQSQARVSNSTFSGNVASYGGALADYVSSARYDISNSTFSGNRARNYGGALNLVQASTADITHVTMVGNSAERGHAIAVNEDASIRMRKSIVSGEWGQCAGTLAENSDNLISDGSCATTLKGDPKLGGLVQTDESATPYHPLLSVSSLIDAVDCDSHFAADQIGTARPQGAACDIGAIEYDPAAADELCFITTTHVLRYREQPGGSVIGTVPEGATYGSLGYADGWHQIEYNNQIGWISADYVVAEGICEGLE